MSSKSMDVFELRNAVISEYRQFATSFTSIYAEDIRAQVKAIYDEGRFWPEPLLQINPHYKRGLGIPALIKCGALAPRTAEIFRNEQGSPLQLYKHQERAVVLASQGESYVVTTGTGSGKSLCFFIPIVSAILDEKRKHPSAVKRTRAIIIYPMNALANSQLEELSKFVKHASDRPIKFARYTGQENSKERHEIADDPPDILLTNFMMLELLMTRQDELDRKVIGNCQGLRFLVLDELHTYRGRQGADVALLVRRVRERLSPDRLQCIGTSATMASEGSVLNKQEVVASVASKLFSTHLDPSKVIIEELERVTDPTLRAEHVSALLGPAIDAGVRQDLSDEELRKHPLAIWTETRLGITTSETNYDWHRAAPRTLDEAAHMLSVDAERSEEACRQALRDLLFCSSLSERDRTGRADSSDRSFFAFKLHQFISGAGHAFATLEPAGKRKVTVEGQQFLPGESAKRLYPLHFCRECGHEYHPVRLVTEGSEQRFFARDIDDIGPSSDTEDDTDQKEQSGFLTLHARDAEFDFNDLDEDYPESWLDFDAKGNVKFKKTYRHSRVQQVFVAPDGLRGVKGEKAWFIPGRFRFCLRCCNAHSGAARDRTRLASLSAEGRSSATTVLVSSALRWMHSPDSNLDPTKRKLLGFTDNRQDAALQAGHFNDFIFVSLVRAAFLGALNKAEEDEKNVERGVRAEALGAAQQQALGFSTSSPLLRSECLIEPSLKGLNLQEAESSLRQVLAYRVWFDQRRGWRYTNPNLEQLGLIEVEYRGIDELAADEELYTSAPDVLRFATPQVRKAVYCELFDHLRKSMAIHSDVLIDTMSEQMLQRSHTYLRAPWGFGVDERPAKARWLFVTAPKKVSARDEDLIVRGGSRSALGKLLKSSLGSPTTAEPKGRRLWAEPSAVRALKQKDFDKLIEALLSAAVTHGLVSREPTSFGEESGYRLKDTCVLFKRGASPNRESNESKSNAYFRELYEHLAFLLTRSEHALFGFEAREHTAQVDADKRAVREKRFRYGKEEADELEKSATHLRDIGEGKRFLPVLFCSPTMELGVDISELNAVYLRNVPPTPANYAQRSGRAGRSGQAALVLTYSSSQSPHDQYFFRDPRAMVHGEVRPPLLDLANRDLIESHLSAVWLACTEQPLDQSIAKLLELNTPNRPLKDELKQPMLQERVSQEARARICKVLAMLESELTAEQAPWYPGPDAFAEQTVTHAMKRFDAAFHRWRHLFLAAEQQRDAARVVMDSYGTPQHEVRAAQSRHAQAMDQLNLLQTDSHNANSVSSDFNTYRYLATEGFLPGYNFPRLPLMAYVPSTNDGRGRQTYLQRPRFLALAEFGPRSLVYHEGRAFRVVRAMLALQPSAGGVKADAQLPTSTVRICNACGAGHWSDVPTFCHACSKSLGDAAIVNHTYRIENVATQPAERITANDEERQRQGFDLQTTFEWATRDGELDVRRGEATNSDGVIAHLAYGPGATITRLNKGLRRRKDLTKLGFLMNPVSGYWAKNEDEDDSDAPVDPTKVPKQWIVPSVQDRKNALLLQPARSGLSQQTLATLQHALLRGIEAVFQLEAGELLAEPLPIADVRTGFLFYEGTEGGAGVLTRLVSEPDRLAIVARKALEIMHFELPDELPSSAEQLINTPDTACVAACYHCVMSYYNQPDHELLDRRDPDARSVLLQLAKSALTLTEQPVSKHPSALPSPEPAADDAAARWRAFAHALPAPDPQPLTLTSHTIPLIWRAHFVVALLTSDDAACAHLRAQGFEVVVLGEHQEGWHEPTAQLAALLGASS